MKVLHAGLALGFVLAWAGPVPAEDMVSKALPTLLIKGEVVSVDANDPSATLLKVKDRYGFETPIFLTGETQVVQGGASTSQSNLSAGTPVEVEYNFDVNTAKRHAVSVKLTTPGDAAAVPAAPAAAPEPAAEPEAPVAQDEPVPAPAESDVPVEEPAAEAVPTP